jgi:hypothetical protein
LDDKAASDGGWTDAQIQKASGRKLQKAQDENKPLKQQIINSESECPSPKTPQTKRRHNDTTSQRRRISDKKADEIRSTMARNMAQHPLPSSNVDDKSSSNVEAAAVQKDDPDGIIEMLKYHVGIVAKMKAHPTTDNRCNPDVRTTCSKHSPVQFAMMAGSTKLKIAGNANQIQASLITNSDDEDEPLQTGAYTTATSFRPQSSTTKPPQHMAMTAERVLDPRTFDRFDDTNSDEQSQAPNDTRVIVSSHLEHPRRTTSKPVTRYSRL